VPLLRHDLPLQRRTTEGASLNNADPAAVLVVAPSWIGDALMSQALLMRLSARAPAIDVLAAPALQPLFRRMSEVRAVILHPFVHGRLDWAARWRLGRQLAGRYACAYVLPNNWKSALVPCFAGIRQRIGYLGERRYGLLNVWRRLDAAALPRLVDRYAALACEADRQPVKPAEAPRLRSSAEQQAAARQAFGLAQEARPLIFCPGAEYGPAKRWPAEHFAALARLLTTPAAPVLLLGGPNDKASGRAIAELAGGYVRDLCGQTTLDEAIDLIAGARAVVSNDTGLMHVAAALDRPLLALYGSSSPAYTPPLSARARILSLALDCAPCFRRQCPLGHMRCLTDLSPARVAEALQSLPQE